MQSSITIVNDYCDTALHILVCLVLKNPKSSFISLKNTALKKSLKPSVILNNELQCCEYIYNAKASIYVLIH